MTDTDYRQIIRGLPDLAAQLAVDLTPSKVQRLGERVTGGGTPDTMAPIDRAIEDLELLMTSLRDQWILWAGILAEYGEIEPMYGIHAAPTCRYSEVVADEPEVAWLDATKVTAWLLDELDDILVHPLAYMLTDTLDTINRRLVKPRETRHTQREDCPRCIELTTPKHGTVVGDLEHAQALCTECGETIRAETWMRLRDAAVVLNVAERTIRDWIKADAVKWRHAVLNGREVEIRSAVLERDARRARELANLTRRSAAGM